MARVIAVQEEQLKKLNENYSKNVPINTVSSINNADILSDSLNIPIDVQKNAPIDMETQTVNLGQPNFIETAVTNSDVTNEVFGTQTQSNTTDNVASLLSDTNVSDESIQPVFMSGLNDETASNSTVVPYQEPKMDSTVFDNILLDNNLNKIILDIIEDETSKFKQNIQSRLSKYIDDNSTSENTGAVLINTNNSEMAKEEKVNSNYFDQTSSVGNSEINIFNNQSANDLDKTVVIPGEILTNAINEKEN